MKRHAYWFAALIVLATGFALRAQSPAEDAAPPSERVALRLNLAQGQVSAYRIAINQTGTMTLEGAGQGMPVNSDMSADAKLFVDKVKPGGDYAVRYRMGNIKATVMFAGQTISIPNLPKSLEIAGSLSSRGVFTPTEPVKGGLPGAVDATQTLAGLLSNLVGLPAQPIAVGESWESFAPLTLDPSGTARVTMTNTVSAIEGEGGNRVAVVLQTFDGPLDVNIVDPVAVQLTGTFNGTGSSRISIGTGRTLSATTTAKMNGKLATSSMSGTGETTTMLMDLTVASKITSVDLPPAAPAVSDKQAPVTK